MTDHLQNPTVRRVARVLALTPAIAVASLTTPAFAEPPDAWADNPSVSPLYVLLVLAVIPLGLFLLITLLVYVPSMSRGESYQPGEVWRGEPTWFGGPRRGIDAVEADPAPVAVGSGNPTSTRGGASGHW